MSSATLQDDPSVESFFNVAETETLALFEHLSFEFLEEFDASLFPSWRPNHFNNTRAPTHPHYLPDSDILEIPFTVYSDWIRIPTALSYCQVLGRPYMEALKRKSSPIVLNLHMHDLATPDTINHLPPFYKAIYRRNKDGFDVLTELLRAYRKRGREFGSLSDVYTQLEG